MKTSSKQLASMHRAAPVSLLAALVAAILAIALWGIATPAYAEDDLDPNPPKTTTLPTTDLNSLEGVTDKYSQLFEAQDWNGQARTDDKSKVTISELTNEEGRFIQISAAQDADLSIAIVQVGTGYLESAIPNGKMKAGSTCLIPVAPDATVMKVVLYKSNAGDAANGDEAGNAEEGNGEDATDEGDAVDDVAGTDEGEGENGAEGMDGTEEPQLVENADGDEGADGTEGDGTDEGADGTEGTEGDGTEGNDGTDEGADGTEGDGTDDGTDGTEGDGTDEGADGTDDGTDDGTEGTEGDGTDDGTDGTEGDGTDEGTDGTDEGTEDENATETDDGTIVVAASSSSETTTSTSSSTTKVSIYSISINKVDSRSNALLGGADFTLKTKAGDTFASWTSSANGPQLVEGLRTDTTYVLTETKAPQGYNREKDINIRYDAASNRVLIDQGGSSVALDNNSSGAAVLTVKDMPGTTNVQTNASTTPKTGDNQMIPIIVAVLAIVVVIAGAVAVKARKSGK